MAKTIQKIEADAVYQQFDDTVLDLIDYVGVTELRTNFQYRTIYDTVYRLCVAIGDDNLTNGIPYHDGIEDTVRLIILNLMGSGGGAVAPFNFDPATARYIFTGDSITALDDDTGFLYWGTGMGGGALYMPPYMHQGVSGSEINEGTPASNIKDLLYPSRKQLLIDAAQSGDVVAIAIGTNSVSDQASSVTIAGLKELYAAVLDKGAFIEAYTILPSASNAGTALDDVNAFINSLDIDGFSYGGTDYPATKFCVIDGYAAWGGTYVGHTDNGNLHPNTLGALKIGRARRTKLKSISRAYHKLYGTTNPSGNLLANWNLAAGSAGTLTGTGNTLTNNGVPTGIAVTCTANAGLTIVAETVASHSPSDSLYTGVAPFPVLKLTVTGTALLQADIAISMQQAITSEAAGSPFDSFCYAKWKGIGVDDPTALFGLGYGYASVTKWASQNSSTLTNYTNITLGDEAVLRGRSVPPVAAFGTNTMVMTARVRSGESPSFELYFGQPFAGQADRVAYAVPKSLNTDQYDPTDAAVGTNTATIGGVRATGPQVGTSNTSWTATNGATVTGRPGLSWYGGGLTFQFTWQKITAGVITDVAGPTTVTTTAATTQYVISGVSGDKFRLKVTATNSFGSVDAYSVWSSALA